LAVIRIKASHNEVWDYIKFIFNDGEVRREFRKPIPPVVKDYTTESDADSAPIIKTLINDQFKRYKMDYKIYKDELKEW
jgi:hypothetical protein